MNKKYLSDYDITEIDGKKRLRYNGPLFRINLNAEQLKHAKRKLLAYSFLSAVLYLCMGLTGNEITRAVYTGLPYALMIVPVAFACQDAVKFFLLPFGKKYEKNDSIKGHDREENDKAKNDMEKKDYEGSFLHILAWAVATMVCSGTACIGGVFYHVFVPKEITGEYLFIPLALLITVISVGLFREVRYIKSHIAALPKPNNPPDALPPAGNAPSECE